MQVYLVLGKICMCFPLTILHRKAGQSVLMFPGLWLAGEHSLVHPTGIDSIWFHSDCFLSCIYLCRVYRRRCPGSPTGWPRSWAGWCWTTPCPAGHPRSTPLWWPLSSAPCRTGGSAEANTSRLQKSQMMSRTDKPDRSAGTEIRRVDGSSIRGEIR